MIFPAAGNNWKKNNNYNEKRKKNLMQKIWNLGYCPIILQDIDCIATWVCISPMCIAIERLNCIASRLANCIAIGEVYCSLGGQ